MKKLMTLLVALLLATAPYALAQADYATVTGTNIQDSTGTKVASGTITFSPVTNAGTPVSFRAGGGGQVISTPVSATVTNGSFSVQLADTTLTYPSNICYAVTVTNNVTGQQVLGSGYGCVQMSSNWCSTVSGVETCNFDNYTPAEQAGVTVATPTLTVGNITSANQASASIVGTSPNYRLNLSLPVPTLSAGTTTVGTSADDYGATVTAASPGNYLLNVKLPLAPSATDTTKVPLAGGTLSGSVNQNFANYFNPQFGQNASAGAIGNVDNYFWSGSLPGNSSYNNGQYDFFQNVNTLVKDVPGCAGFAASCYNTESTVANDSEFINTQGGTNVANFDATHYGIGDTIANYDSILTFGGQSDGGGPEGAKIISAQVAEPPDSYEGTVAVAGAGQTTLSLTCTEDCGIPPYGFAVNPDFDGRPASVGQGLYALDEQTPTASAQIVSSANGSGEIPGTITLNVTAGLSNLAVSTCYGTLNSTLTPTPDPSGSGTQSVTFTITLASGSGSCVAGQIMSFAGFMHDQALVTAVGTPSGGQQSITASIRQHHESGSYVFENPPSDAGLYANILANDVSGVQFPLDILGVQSISGNTAVVWYRWFYAGETPGNDNFPFGNVYVGALSPTSLSNSGGTVTFNGTNAVFNSQNLYISNASNSAFDGECTGASVNYTTNTTTCTQAGSTGQTATSATVTLAGPNGNDPYGNGDLNLYQGAMIVDPQDHAAPITINGQTLYPADGKQFEVEANNMPLASGDLIVEGHSAAIASQLVDLRDNVLNPSVYTSRGIALTFSNLYGDPNNSGQQRGALNISNTSPLSNYAYFGGEQNAPMPFHLGGQWSGLLWMDQAPSPGGALFRVNTPATGATDANYSYSLYTLIGNGGAVQDTYFPAINTLEFNGPHQFNAFDSAGDAFNYHVSGAGTWGIVFGGVAGSSSGHLVAPTWGNGGAATAGDLVVAGLCVSPTSCGVTDSGINQSKVISYVGTLTTTAATSDTLSATSVPVGAACSVEPQDATAASLTGVFVPLVTTAGIVLVNHSATAGGHFSVFCNY
jgi:hypothetical protein